MRLLLAIVVLLAGCAVEPDTPDESPPSTEAAAPGQTDPAEENIIRPFPPRDERSYMKLVEYQVLLRSRWFATRSLAPTRSRTPYAIIAYELLLDSDEAQEAFWSLVEHGTPAGQLYGLCGLYHQDTNMFKEQLGRYTGSSVKLLHSVGTKVAPIKISELIAAGHLSPFTGIYESLRLKKSRDVEQLLADKTVEKWIEQLARGAGDAQKLAKAVLGNIGEDTVGPLIDAITQAGDKQLRLGGFVGIGWVGPRARATVPVLVGALEHAARARDTDIVRAAANALMGIGPWARAGLPALEKLLADEKAYTGQTRRILEGAVRAIRVYDR